MAIREILNEQEDILKKHSRKVERFDERLHTLLDDMVETMHAADGVGLAAVQVGILRRVVVVDIGEGVIELVNPEIIEESGVQEDIEGCLSCPGKYGITRRPMHVKLRAQNRKGKPFEMTADGLLARAFCHELDHLDGGLFYDHVIRMVDPKDL